MWNEMIWLWEFQSGAMIIKTGHDKSLQQTVSSIMTVCDANGRDTIWRFINEAPINSTSSWCWFASNFTSQFFQRAISFLIADKTGESDSFFYYTSNGTIIWDQLECQYFDELPLESLRIQQLFGYIFFPDLCIVLIYAKKCLWDRMRMNPVWFSSINCIIADKKLEKCPAWWKRRFCKSTSEYLAFSGSSCFGSIEGAKKFEDISRI